MKNTKKVITFYDLVMFNLFRSFEIVDRLMIERSKHKKLTDLQNIVNQLYCDAKKYKFLFNLSEMELSRDMLLRVEGLKKFINLHFFSFNRNGEFDPYSYYENILGIPNKILYLGKNKNFLVKELNNTPYGRKLLRDEEFTDLIGDCSDFIVALDFSNYEIIKIDDHIVDVLLRNYFNSLLTVYYSFLYEKEFSKNKEIFISKEQIDNLNRTLKRNNLDTVDPNLINNDI